jgi:hypothetical protein
MTKDIDETREHKKGFQKFTDEGEIVFEKLNAFLKTDCADENISSTTFALMLVTSKTAAIHNMGYDVFVRQMKAFYRFAEQNIVKEKK